MARKQFTKTCPQCLRDFSTSEKRQRSCSKLCGNLSRFAPLSERFRRSFESSSEGCWVWAAAKSGSGYGHIRSRGKLLQAHRVSWMIHYGEIPDGAFVLHHCDNPPCVRPDHLFLGNDASNTADKVSKGRQSVTWGEACGNAKLTESEVREIRSICGLPIKSIASAFGVSKSTVFAIRARRIWAHLGEVL